MPYWTLFIGVLVLVCAQHCDSKVSECSPRCVGEEYVCISGQCYCADGYWPNHFQSACIKCPGLGEKCYGPCCNAYGNGTLRCWYGVCQSCYDSYGNFICRDALDQILIVTTTQAIMGTALILGIIATFILLFKLCATTDLRPIGHGSHNVDNRLSIGSLQLYVDERLRDAPPRYSRTPPTESTPYLPVSYLNEGFIHDCSVPPPPYAAVVKNEVNRNIANPTLHI